MQKSSKNDVLQAVPVATPVEETMTRFETSQVQPQQMYQAGAVADVAASIGAQCVRIGTGCNSTKYGVFTMRSNANGFPVRMQPNNKLPSMTAKFVGLRKLTMFDGPSRNGESCFFLSLLFEYCRRRVCAQFHLHSWHLRHFVVN
jgi:hypothetical protein